MLDVKRGSRNRRREQRREGSRTGTRKKNPTHTNFNYAFIYHRNKGLFTGQQQRVLPGKSTQLLQLTRGTSQCKWWCVNGAVLKAQEKYGMRVAYHLTWLALAVSSHSVYSFKYFSFFGILLKFVIHQLLYRYHKFACQLNSLKT